MNGYDQQLTEAFMHHKPQPKAVDKNELRAVVDQLLLRRGQPKMPLPARILLDMFRQ
jgi:hypothetical protein